MSATTIEWADESWNPVTGCSYLSEGCAHCYAERRAKMLAGNPLLLPSVRERYRGFRPALHPERLAAALRHRKAKRVFVNSMGDLFHSEVPNDWRDLVFAVIAAARVVGSRWRPEPPVFLVLTKRAERMRGYFACPDVADRIAAAGSRFLDQGDAWLYQPGWITEAWPLPHLWLGVTAENQRRADERIPELLGTPAATRFVSIEPMLGAVNLGPWLELGRWDSSGRELPTRGVDWVICGGETGPGSRPLRPEWVRSLRDQCRAAAVPFFFKGWGEYCAPSQMPDDLFQAWDCEHGCEAWDRDEPRWRVGKKTAGRLLDEDRWEEVPA